MKSTVRLIKFCGIPIRILLILLFPLFSYSQTFFGVSSSPADNGAQAGPTTTITPPTLMVTNDLVVVYAEYRGTAGVTFSMSTTGGQTWNVGSITSGSNQSFAIFWCTYNGSWPVNPVVSAGAGNTNALTAVMYVFRPSVTTSGWGVNVAQTNGSTTGANPNTITGVTTTAPNTVTMGFWSSAFANTWGTLAGTSWVKTGLTAQYRNTTGTDQSHTAAYVLKTTAGAIANVSQNETGTTTPDLTSIMSWYQTGNDDCNGAITLTSGTTCANTAGTVLNATYTPTLTDCSGSTPTYDVWYKFVAQTTNPTITLSSVGSNFNTPRLQVFSGSCGSFSSVACSTSPSLSVNPTGLTVGTIYYVRAYSLNGAAPTTNGTFNICVTDPAPVNDDCAGAVTLTSGTTCVGTTGNVVGSTLSSGIPAPTGCGTPTYDVWYKFTAQSTNPTIAISGATNFTSQHIQILTGGCGSLGHFSCGTSGSLTASGLTIGTTYYVRVYSTAAVPSTAGTFSICITDPAPANDNCAGAISLTSGTTCVNTLGNVIGSTLSASIPAPTGCGTPTYDVWYKFTAQTTNPTITISGNTNFANPHIQLLSGACASLVHVSCSNSGVLTASGLTIGTSYSVRVYSTSAVPSTSGSFNICVTDPAPANDDCSGAISLTPGSTCSTIQGNVVGATLSSPVPLPTCGTPTYDVWYKFTATSPSQTVTISGNTNFANPGIQVFSGACGSLFTIGCSATATVTVPSLTIGVTYYVRVYSTSAVPTTAGSFNICVVDAPGNDDCGAPVLLTSGASCVTINGTLVNATNVALANTCAALTGTRKDVWYTFVAQTVNPTITITTAVANPRFQIFSGTCASLNSIFCSTSGSQAATGLTVGTTYLMRVYSNTDASGTFTICVDDPAPVNDNCSGVVTLTSSTVCTTVTGTMYGATASATTITAPDCAGAVAYDVWYKFVAQTTNPTITLSNLGANFTNPGMQLLSNNCGGTFISYFCGTTSISADFLTPGTTYYIRVYSTSGSAPTSVTDAGFDICVVDAVTTPPYNDDCANAINVPIWNTCNNVSGTMAGSTASSIALGGSCTGPLAYDVWYKFTSVNTTATLTLSSIGANFTNPRIEVLSGTCGSLSSVACGTSPLAASGLTAGAIYLVRIYSTTAPAPNGNAGFNLCATTTNAPVRFGNSYVNLSKKTTGGVIQPGDTLEIRMTINHTSGTMTNLRYVDNIPTHTSMLSTTNDSIRIITNEGLVYKKYTPAAGDDAATYNASPGAGQYNIRMNLGFGGTLPGTPANTSNSATGATGSMNGSTDKPRGGGGMLFATAYRVKVTGAVGDTVTLFPGQFIYQNGGTDVTLAATPFNIVISDPLTLCANSTGLNNAVENGGTFGSGGTLNRGTDLSTPIAGYTFIPNVNAFTSVNDGRYAIVNNVSPRASTTSGARRQPNCNVSPAIGPNDPLSCNNRMFGGFWFIEGDHSGTGNSVGNIPPGTGTNSGYMLEVNADYVASEVYRQTINNLCPNTYYEFSAWVQNICPTCGIDSNGTSTYKPGVLPNLTFALNDLDYYNSGEMDTVGWQKKGFVFKTAVGQTTATFSIRNNAQGGGGNDWALDDIAIATCLPTMQYSPSINPMVCESNSLAIYDTVRSFFNNYTNYKWERSVDLGNNWTDITLPVDTVLTQAGSVYQFITKYTIPPAHTTLANSNDLYRVVVATNTSNLANASCLYTDASTIITLSVLDCGPVLKIDLLSFTGKNNHGSADLQWVTSKEEEPISFVVEKSGDGNNFSAIGTVKGTGNAHDNNYYEFTDPVPISGKVWYRLTLLNKDGKKKKYSRVITLSDTNIQFGFNNVVNPFTQHLDFELSVPENSRIETVLINLSGKPVRKENFSVYQGLNSLSIPNTDNLPAGMYVLQVSDNGTVISKKMIKK